MFGFGGMTDEMLKRFFERQEEHRRRADALVAKGISPAEAFMRVTADMEWEAWDAAEQAKLADIRENGT